MVAIHYAIADMACGTRERHRRCVRRCFAGNSEARGGVDTAPPWGRRDGRGRYSPNPDTETRRRVRRRVCRLSIFYQYCTIWGGMRDDAATDPRVC